MNLYSFLFRSFLSFATLASQLLLTFLCSRFTRRTCGAASSLIFLMTSMHSSDSPSISASSSASSAALISACHASMRIWLSSCSAAILAFKCIVHVALQGMWRAKTSVRNTQWACDVVLEAQIGCLFVVWHLWWKIMLFCCR